RLRNRTNGTGGLAELPGPAIFAFGGGEMDDIALPSRSRLDAEQVVTGGAIGAQDFTLAPTRLQGRLTKKQFFRHATLIRSYARCRGHLGHKALYVIRGTLDGGIDLLGQRIARQQVDQVAYG